MFRPRILLDRQFEKFVQADFGFLQFGPFILRGIIAKQNASCTVESDFCATCDEFETCDNMKPYRGDGTSTRDKMNAFLRAKNIRANG